MLNPLGSTRMYRIDSHVAVSCKWLCHSLTRGPWRAYTRVMNIHIILETTEQFMPVFPTPLQGSAQFILLSDCCTNCESCCTNCECCCTKPPVPPLNIIGGRMIVLQNRNLPLTTDFLLTFEDHLVTSVGRSAVV